MRIPLASACFLTTLFASAYAYDLALVHARAYPTPDAPPLEDATIVLHGNRIAFVSQGKSKLGAKVPRNATVIDCTGMSVTAGLWNSHVHILPVQFLHADRKSDAQLSSALQGMLTRWGFTTVFDIASILDNTNEIRARIAADKVLGPRILTTGEPFFPPHGIPIYIQGYLEQNHITLPDDRTTAAAVQRVRNQVSRGADGIKIFAGSIEQNSVLLMPFDRALAIVKEAHSLKRPVFAHPSNQAGVDIALRSGVDVLAHVTSDESPWPPSLVQRMRMARMALIPTLTLFEEEARKAGASPEDVRLIVDRSVARLRAYFLAGGEILFGTDVGYIHKFDTSDEYALMQSAGMTFTDILASLTTNPAHRFGFAQHSGRIAKDMDADLTVLQGDPAVEITALSRVRYTIRAGRIVYQLNSDNAAAVRQ